MKLTQKLIASALFTFGAQPPAAVYADQLEQSTEWAQTQKLTAPDGQRFDEFGRSVAIDGNTAVVGAFGENTGGDNAGALYVYTRNRGAWKQQAKLTLLNPSPEQQLGLHVSLDGDTIASGVGDEDELGNLTGSVRIFERRRGVWSEQAKIVAPNGKANESFGVPVIPVVRGDLLAVGDFSAPVDGVENAGAVYVFRRQGQQWLPLGKITAPKPRRNALFGYNLDLSDKYLAINARSEHLSGSTLHSVVYAYERVGSRFVLRDRIALRDVDGTPIDFLVESLAISGDRVVAGAPFSDAFGTFSGAAYVFKRRGTRWIKQQTLAASDADLNDLFGISVAIDRRTIVIGAWGDKDDSGELFQGAAYVFSERDGHWRQVSKLRAADGTSTDGFGQAVAVSGQNAISGAASGVGNEPDSGAAYIFEAPDRH